MINNISQIVNYIKEVAKDKTSSDLFYFLQIIQRKKENENLSSNNRVIKSYYIENVDSLNNYFEEIKNLCNLFNARAYIHLTPRRWSMICAQQLKANTELLINQQYKGIKNSLDSIIGQYSATPKTWVVDLDSHDLFDRMYVEKCINRCRSGHSQNVIMTLHTKNGCHFITHPFNLNEFECGEKVDIHKNNPTILYIP